MCWAVEGRAVMIVPLSSPLQCTLGVVALGLHNRVCWCCLAASVRQRTLRDAGEMEMGMR